MSQAMSKRVSKRMPLVVPLALAAGMALADPASLFSSPAPALPGELRREVMISSGNEREYLYYLPETLPANAPVVLVFHGSMSTGESARGAYHYRFDVLADQYGFLPVYPTGFDKHWNDCRAGADYQAKIQNIDDIAFLRAVVDELAERHSIDTSRVFATGLSNGGHMTYRLALEAPDLVAGIAPIAASLPTWDNNDCTPKGASLPVMIINGTEDPINPYQGGVVNVFGNTSRGKVMSSLETAAYFAGLANHQEPAGTRVLSGNPPEAPGIESTTWKAPGKDTIMHYAVVGAGHWIPSRVPSPAQSSSQVAEAMRAALGAINDDIESAEEIWAFFHQVGSEGDVR